MAVSVQDLLDKIHFHVIYSTETALQKEITTSEIMRPGLEMAGYFDYFTPERIQLFGMKEWSYMMTVVGDNRYDLLKKVMAKETPVVIVARNLEIPSEMVAAAKKADIVLLQSREATSRLNSVLTSFLDERLAERTTVHGVLMDIFGVGVLIQGASGIGKSETGLELVKRGHRLVADDRVDVFQRDAFTLSGEPAEILRNMIEIRGVGIIDVMSLFGAGAVKDSTDIDMVIYLEYYDKEKAFDRLGNAPTIVEFSDVEVPQTRIPVKTGRNVSVIVEAAVMNFRAKQMGFDATKTFEDRLTDLISHNKESQ
ncbi:Hpr(Ser) kinase/phosphatase [Lactococcus cremoris subsp. cremoris SK11]|uniref:HPr kinase/phosphorylase n=2 Tax=Lactococcus lactis subsp. cremoris TaxID=1359 RepID=HPRK_LACLS|nr:HPr(Ser) kinase/phosphatase [Lactococcus cremoris]Q031B7.1 RecName: Full=HPr kinase/phosphorylase; Short=HPrK/P; AltName: Full=HPr(Ser) kinase/phosphorylase [Lactococcus cremoris subsp. cremoris SK11]ABJ72205.1 Hpr(Ser) kinase/phosphatase [Lactococcus cremoris subsp. cremoris SK11]ARE22804.1 HPr(Ser) kinase/phosphatase [Lactococcus cremoris]KZK45043.1 HPr kinase/phosphorylase [Lactococcus cremoris]KZK52176.1 HPr kinase/phosphorylase [Lactococcus cremoris]MCT4407768.1 HPr kinase/phosphoryla